MAAPNLVNVATITGQSNAAALTTSNAAIVTCGSEYVCKVNTVIVSNVDGTNTATATVYFYDSSQSARYQIINAVAVPAGTSLTVVGKDTPIYLEEGDKIEGLASANSDLQIIVSYDAITD
tara:strand:+ start:254 stop:616 length:363 start_codon:yes stop_codon:yes gene_type:complete